MVNDALDMGLILLVTGAVMYVTRKEDLNDVSGLAHRSVPLAVLFLLGILAISGMPPLNGFASKVIIYESVFRLNPLLSVIGILGSIMMLAVFVKVFASVFLGVPYGGYVSKVPGSMLASMFMLAGIMLFIGLFPGLVLDCVIMPATEALINPGLYIGGFV